MPAESILFYIDSAGNKFKILCLYPAESYIYYVDSAGDKFENKFLLSAESMYICIDSAGDKIINMRTEIVGRHEEKVLLTKIYNSNNADLLTVTGRRRVGKTFLIKSVFANKIDFELIGVLNATMEQQLQNFQYSLNKMGTKKHKIPFNWLDAFHALSLQFDRKRGTQKKVIFIDEFPWLDTHKSSFLAAFDWFWNSWAVNQNILVVICGSAASWIVANIIDNKGGLHNRVTKRIHLNPFNLSETELFLKSKKNNLSRHQIIQIYMVFGGIPLYLNEIEKGESAMQNIQRICFSESGLLTNEFDNLYKALFANSDLHEKIIFALSKKHKGLTRGEILKIAKVKDGGTFSKTLKELDLSGFVSSLVPFEKTIKDTLYRLTDEFSLFYIKFMYKKSNVNWNQLAQTQTWKTWSGYAFENTCLKHQIQIKKALGIAAVYTEFSSFFYKGTVTNNGAQIDLIIDRNDGVINIIEIKFSSKEFTLNKAYAKELKNKLDVFQEISKTNKTLFLTLLTTFGVVENINSIGFVQQDLICESLFL